MKQINITITEVPILCLVNFSDKMGWYYNRFTYQPAIVYRKPNGFLYVKWLNGHSSTNISDDNYLLAGLHHHQINIFEPIEVWIKRQNWFYKFLFSIVKNKYLKK